MSIQGAGRMIMMLVLVLVMAVVGVGMQLPFAKVTQGQAGHLIQSLGRWLTIQQALQKTLQIRTDPVHPVRLSQLAAI